MIGLFDPYIIRAEFNIPVNIEPTALILLGHPEKRFLSKNRHSKERKPLNETVQYEEYQNR